MSLEVKTILCAVAMTESSEGILLRALHEAKVHDAEVQIIHMIPSYEPSMAMPIVSFMGEEKFSQLIEEHKKESTETIRKEIEHLKNRIIKEHLKESVDRIAAIHVYEGDPVLEILHMADRLEADLLVMGTHAKGFTEHTFVGSVARKVLKRIKIPVLLVPPVSG